MDIETSKSAETPLPTPTRLKLPTFWQEIWEYRSLLRNLVTRDLKVRYKNSLLGIFWSVLNPLMIVAVFTIVFSKFRGADLIAYPVFVLVGILPWNSFSASVMSGANSVVGNASLINKVYFPRIILPTTVVLSNLVNFLIVLVILLLLLIPYGISLTVHALWVPVLMVAQIMLTLGLVYFFSAANVYFRDIGQILDVALLAGFFLTPIIYSLDDFCRTELFGIAFDPAQVMRWVNPLASIIDGYRTVLWGQMEVANCGTPEMISIYGPPAGMGIDFILRTLITCFAIMMVGFLFFRKFEGRFAEEL